MKQLLCNFTVQSSVFIIVFCVRTHLNLQGRWMDSRFDVQNFKHPSSSFSGKRFLELILGFYSIYQHLPTAQVAVTAANEITLFVLLSLVVAVKHFYFRCFFSINSWMLVNILYDNNFSKYDYHLAQQRTCTLSSRAH